ncbi:prominin-1 isoform X3 [Cervus elaphus]|uniref:prominin-1 isoform X3 n=1 Tax=Cervus elaphus TaxID=9860 RepID=UPI001CC2B532|nr:prominin-1 isoform X3 [Cervus elaphus]
MVLLLSFLLLLGLCEDTVSEEPSSSGYRPADLEFQLPSTPYQTSDSYDPGPAGFFFHIVRLFVHVVQPNAFPEDILRNIIQKKFDPSKEYDKIIYYEIGVIICAALGLLFIILMPLVGFFFCLCRCCNKCGGEMHQRQKKNGPFLKKYFTVSLLVICVFMSIGIIYGFAANQYMRTHVEETRKLSDSNFNDLRTLLNAVPGQIDYILEQYTRTKEKAFDDLDNINLLLGGSIYERLKPKVLPVLKDIKALAEDMKTNRATLARVNTVLTDMKQSSAHLRTSLRDMKTSMEQTLTDPQCTFPVTATTCASIRQSLNVLDGSANFDQLPSLDGHIAQLDGLLQTDLSSLVQKANDSLSDIPGEVKNQTRDFISEFKKTLNSIQSDVKNVSTKIPIQKTLSNFVRYINNSEDYILHYLPTVEKCNSYRWLVCLTICCLLTLILIFYLLGLLCGTLGYDQNATPTNRGCVSNTGGVLLMVGVGFSFFFSWIVMTIVVLTFVTGGNLENLVCEPYRNKKFFQILDTPYLLNEDWEYYLSGLVLNKPDINLTFEQVYSDCKENKGLYATLKLDHIYNVSEELNITKHTGDINSNLENMNLRINDIELLDKTGRKTLMDISSSGIGKIDYAAYINATEGSPTRVNLRSFADNLQRKANQLPPGNLKTSLKDHVDTLRNIHQNQVVPLQNSMSIMHQQMKGLHHRTSRLRDRVSNIIFFLNSTQYFLTSQLAKVVIEESKQFGSKIISYFERYLQWVKMAITQQIAACKPAATALDSAVNVFLCSYIVDPLNLFWFGIGKATVLLLPALIFAVKLAKYLRRMYSEDVYEDEPVHNIRHANTRSRVEQGTQTI